MWTFARTTELVKHDAMFRMWRSAYGGGIVGTLGRREIPPLTILVGATMVHWKRKETVVKDGKKVKRGGLKRREKLIVTFDEKEREEYLTGFHKRKLLRRKNAIEQLKVQAREDRLRDRSDRREAVEERIAANKAAMRTDVKVYDVPAPIVPSDKKEEYEDDFTKKALGGESVTVTTTFGLGLSSDEDDTGEDDSIVPQGPQLPGVPLDLMKTPIEMKKKYDKEEKERDVERAGKRQKKATTNSSMGSEKKRAKLLQKLTGKSKDSRQSNYKQRGSTARRQKGQSKHSRAHHAGRKGKGKGKKRGR